MEAITNHSEAISPMAWYDSLHCDIMVGTFPCQVCGIEGWRVRAVLFCGWRGWAAWNMKEEEMKYLEAKRRLTMSI